MSRLYLAYISPISRLYLPKASSESAAREEMVHERNERAREAAEARQQRLAAGRRAAAKLKQLRTHAALHRCRLEDEERRAQLQLHLDAVQQAAKGALTLALTLTLTLTLTSSRRPRAP